jgi:hypothetical protein
VLELYNQGVDLEEAAAKVSGELGLTKGMADTALRLALEELRAREPRYGGWVEFQSLGGRVGRLPGGF